MEDEFETSEYEEKLAEEQYVADTAATRIQKICRGHRSRRRAMFMPLWPMVPCPLNGLLGLNYGGHLDLSEQYREVDFKTQLSHLEHVLRDKVSQSDLAEGLTRVWHTIQFATRLGFAYNNQGAQGPASFLWSSVKEICSMPAIIAYNPPNSNEGVIKRSFAVYQSLALSQEAHSLFKSGNFASATMLISVSVKICPKEWTVLSFIFAIQSAVLKCSLGGYKEALDDLSEILSAIKTYCNHVKQDMTNNPADSTVGIRDGQNSKLVNVGFLDSKKVCGHLLVICWHNIAVVLAYVGRRAEMKEAFSRSLSLVGCVHRAQPIRRHIVQAYVASSRDDSFHFDYFQARLELHEIRTAQHGPEDSKRPSGSPQSWKQWFSIVAHSAALAPVWINIGTIIALNLSEADDAEISESSSSVKLSQKAQQISDCEQQRVLFGRSEDNIARLTRWEQKVYVLSAFGHYLYHVQNDFQGARLRCERALNLCEDEFLKSLCQLHVSACLSRMGDYSASFELAKATIDAKIPCLENPWQINAVLAVASQMMALAHIFQGKASHALRCAQIARKCAQSCRLSELPKDSTASVNRTFEIALSMNQIAESAEFQQAKASRGAEHKLQNQENGTRRVSIPRFSPASFVPSILLKSGIYQLDVTNAQGDYTQNSQSGPKMDEVRNQPRRFKWTGTYKILEGPDERTISYSGEDESTNLSKGPFHYAEDQQTEFHVRDPIRHTTKGTPARLLKDWGPDPTIDLRDLSKTWCNQVIKPLHRRSLDLVHSKPSVDMKASAFDSSSTSDKIAITALNDVLLRRVRTSKHFPLQKTLEHSKVGAFLCRRERSIMVKGMESIVNNRSIS